jgi:hypothetical protein
MSTPGLALTHECPAPACTEQIDPGMLMCPPHWYQVPKPVRSRRVDRLARRRWRGHPGAPGSHPPRDLSPQPGHRSRFIP